MGEEERRGSKDRQSLYLQREELLICGSTTVFADIANNELQVNIMALAHAVQTSSTTMSSLM